MAPHTCRLLFYSILILLLKRCKFINTAKEFMVCHDLSGNGSKRREELTRTKIDQLNQRELELKNGTN